MFDMAWVDASEVELAPSISFVEYKEHGRDGVETLHGVWGAFLAHCLGNFGTFSHCEHTWRPKEWNGI